MVEHIERFGEHHAGDAVGHADVRKGAELPGVEHLLQHEGVGHANGSFCRAVALFQGWWLRFREHETALGIAAVGELWQMLLQHVHHGGIAGQGGQIGSHRHLDRFGWEIARRTALIPVDVVGAFVVAVDLAARLGVGRFHGQPAPGRPRAPLRAYPRLFACLGVEWRGKPELEVGFRFCAICNKNAGNAQQNARRERLFIRKSSLSAFFVADSVPGGIIFGRGGLENDGQVAQNLSIFGLLSGRIAGVGGSGDVPAATI